MYLGLFKHLYRNPFETYVYILYGHAEPCANETAGPHIRTPKIRPITEPVKEPLNVPLKESRMERILYESFAEGAHGLQAPLQDP